MADVNANIDINIDTSNALNQLKSLQRQISQFHASIAKSSETAAIAQRSLQKNLLNNINAIGAFSAELKTVKTSAESFTDSLEKNKFSMRKYFTYAAASTKTFGKIFQNEFNTIEEVATERVKKLQTQYIELGRNTKGAMQAISVMPNHLNMDDYSTKIQIAAQKQALFNQLMKQGSTNLLNFGKNTQWAGRQLMVGFTLPLMALGTTASRTFMDMEAQALKFKKVYGDLFTPQAETQQALDNITQLGQMFTKYGIAVSSTVGLAADAAAAGFQGIDLQRQTTEATRLSVLGQIDNQKALETTISLQNAFGMSSENLAGSIDFLNAVENQTVVSLDDITTAIPKVAPVIKQLGGDVKDLTFFIAAMKEGGINASEGANALKSGLAGLINPTKKASDMLAGYGINVKNIVQKNQGDLKSTVVEFAQALDTLAPLERARAIEQMFGKFQFARLSTLFQNVTKDGNQASRVLKLAGTSVEDLAALSEQELGMTADSAMNKFKKSVEDLKASLIPVGQALLEAVTPIIDFVGNILEKFNNLSAGTKKFITILTIGLGAVGPVVLMTFGLLANGVANLIKLFLRLRMGYQTITGQSKVLGEQTRYMTFEQLEAEAVAHSLDQSHASLTQTFNAEASSVYSLIGAYQAATKAARQFAVVNPGAMVRPPKKMATGGVVTGPGTGTSDSIPAMLSNGEAVIPAKSVKKNPSLVAGLIAQNIPGYAEGTVNVSGQAVKMNILNMSNQVNMQRIINEVLSGAAGLKNAEEVVAETLLRLSDDTNASAKKLVRELDIVATELEGKQIPEKIAGERDYSASGAGVKDNVKTQLQASRGDLGLEEVRRAQVASEAVYREYEKIGINGRKLEQALQVDRAHIVEVSQAEKRYMEAWDTRLFVAQARAENEMSMLLTNEKNQKAYISKLSTVDASEEVKNSILYKITKDLALTEDELQVQAKVLSAMLDDAQLMSTTTSQFSTIARGTIAAAGARASMGPASPGVGMRSDVEIAAAQEALNVKKFRGARTFVRRLEQTGESAVTRLLVAMKKKAKIKSPSEETDQIGVDLMRGLDQGMQKEMPSIEKTGANATGSAIGGMRKGQRGARTGVITTGPGTPYNELASQVNVSKGLFTSLKQNAVVTKLATKTVADMSNRMNGAMFALTSLSGMASMAGGNLGKFADLLFQISGPLFALTSIGNLLGGTKFGMFLRGLSMLKFAGIIGAITATVSIMKLLNDAQNRQLQEIYGFSNAMKTTAAQAKVLGEFFNVVPAKRPFDTAGQRELVDQKRRTSRDRLKEDAGFQKEYKSVIPELSKATVDDAKLLLTSIALNLKASGFATTQIQTVVDALREEASKTSVVLDVKSLDLSAESIAGLKTQVAPFVVAFNNEVKKGIKIKGSAGGKGGIVAWESTTKGGKKALADLSTFISETSKSAAGMFDIGLIDGEKYKSTITGVLETMQGLNAEAKQMALMSIFKDMNIDAAPFIKNLQTVEQQMTLIALLSSGIISKDSGILSNIASTDANTSLKGWRDAYAAMDAFKKIQDKLNSDNKKSAAADGTGTGKLNALQEKIKAIQDQTKAFKILRLAQIDAKTATELSNDAEIAALVIANSRGKSLKYIIGLVKKYKQALKEQADTAYSMGDPVDKRMTDLGNLQKQVTLREKIIDAMNASKVRAYNDEIRKQEKIVNDINEKIDTVTKNQISPLQTQIDANNYALESIALKEDVINKKYQDQIDALNKVKTINQDIAQIQQNRLSLADAISRGDISSAAALIQESRAQAASSSISGIETALTNSRDAQIAALGRNKLEQQNKELQFQISTIQYTILKNLESQKATAEQLLQQNQRMLSDLEQTIEDEKSRSLYAGKTREEIALQVALIEAGIDVGEAYKNILSDASLSAEQMAAALWSAVEAQKALSSSKANPYGALYYLTPEASMEADRSRIGAASLNRYSGGIIPRYLASGGLSIGTDTVPAMLTPGEFVMSRYAVDSLGIDNMKAINNGSSIGDSVYNYNVSVNVRSESNPDEIARAVMGQIKQVNSQKIRGNSFR